MQYLNQHNLQLPQQDECASALFHRLGESNHLPALGFERPTFRRVSSCQGIITFLTGM